MQESMKRLIVTLCLAACSGSIWATNWEIVVPSGSVTLEIDTDSLATEKGMHLAKFRFNHTEKQKSANGQFYESSEVVSLFNCETNKYAPFKRKEFSGTNSGGKEVNQVLREGSDIVFYDPVAGSMGEFMYNRVCRKA